MSLNLFISGVLVMAFLMVMAKRIGALIRGFAAQSFFLFLITAFFAVKQKSVELYVVAALLLSIKVLAIPHFLDRIARKIKMDQSVGLIVNPMPSVFIAMLLVYISYLFTVKLLPLRTSSQELAFAVAFAVMLIGLFLMVFRMKAIVQIVGLLVMENGLFLMAGSVPGGMPFFVEIAIFFDIFVCVVILGMFVYRINKVFTHINVSELRELRG